MTRARTGAIAITMTMLLSGLVGAQGYDKKTIEKMLSDGAKKLASANPSEQAQGAGFMLGYITCDYRAQYMPVIIKTLKHHDPKVRSIAAQTLEKIAAKEAIPDLVALLADSVNDVSDRAAFALGTIGDPSAVPGITQARDAARTQKKNARADMFQEALDEISGKSPTEHTHCP